MRLIMFVALILGINACSSDKKARAIIETEYGNMTLELYDSTPEHKANFIKLVNEGFYNDLLFHRVIDGFMIQGGDPDSKTAPEGQRLGGGDVGYLIPAEIGSPHFKGTLAAARKSDSVNPEKKSSGCQFYVVQGRKQTDQQLNSIESSKGIKYTDEQRAKYKEIGGTPMLDMDYTVFGELIDGMDVIDKIATVAKDPYDRPLEDVKMKVKMLN